LDTLDFDGINEINDKKIKIIDSINDGTFKSSGTKALLRVL